MDDSTYPRLFLRAKVEDNGHVGIHPRSTVRRTADCRWSGLGMGVESWCLERKLVPARTYLTSRKCWCNPVCKNSNVMLDQWMRSFAVPHL